MKLCCSVSTKPQIATRVFGAFLLVTTGVCARGANDDRVYTATYLNARDRLQPGTEPDAYWKSCALDQPAGHPVPANPAFRGRTCMKWMLIWGEFLVSFQDREHLEPIEVEQER